MSIKEQPRSFCTIFPNFQDFHFYKDPGQIPYRFSKIGYNASLVCYGKGENFIESEKCLKIKKLPDNYFSRKFNSGILFFFYQFPEDRYPAYVSSDLELFALCLSLQNSSPVRIYIPEA